MSNYRDHAQGRYQGVDLSPLAIARGVVFGAVEAVTNGGATLLVGLLALTRDGARSLGRRLAGRRVTRASEA